MAMDPDVIKAQDILKRLVLRVNGTLVPYNTTTQSFDLTSAGAATETPLAIQLGADAAFLLKATAGGTNGHSPTIDFTKGGSNTRLGVNGSGTLAWISQADETALAVALSANAATLLSVATGGTNGHSPTIGLVLGASGTFYGVKANGVPAWMNVGTTFNFTDTTKRSVTYSGGAGPIYTAQSGTGTFTNPSANQTLNLVCTHALEYAINQNAASTRAAGSVAAQLSVNAGTMAEPTTALFDTYFDFYEAKNGTITWTTSHTLNASQAVTFAARTAWRFPTANSLGKTVPQPASGTVCDHESYTVNAIGVFS